MFKSEHGYLFIKIFKAGLELISSLSYLQTNFFFFLSMCPHSSSLFSRGELSKVVYTCSEMAWFWCRHVSVRAEAWLFPCGGPSTTPTPPSFLMPVGATEILG